MEPVQEAVTIWGGALLKCAVKESDLNWNRRVFAKEKEVGIGCWGS
jgi:hypothetical protein